MEPTIRLITMARRIAIVSHIHPDGDAVASVLSLQHALEQMGKEIYPVLLEGVPDIFSFLPEGDRPVSTELPGDLDLCIVADLSDTARTGFEELVKKYSLAEKLVTIDHHIKGDLARLSTAGIFKEAASTTEIIYGLVMALEVKITPDMATCLLAGIYTDTGGFQYPNTTVDTLEISAELMRRGAKLNLIARQISHTKTVASLKLLGIALQRLRLTHGNRFAVTVLTQDDIAACMASKTDVGGIISELNVLPEVRCTMLLTEMEPGKVVGSLRTGEGFKTKVSSLAKVMGGGGHPRAAGFTITGKIEINEGNGSWQIVPA